jgi:hypothetical protein
MRNLSLDMKICVFHILYCKLYYKHSHHEIISALTIPRRLSNEWKQNCCTWHFEAGLLSKKVGIHIMSHHSVFCKHNFRVEQFHYVRFQVLTATNTKTTAFVTWLFVISLKPWWWRQYAPLKRRTTSATIHSTIFQKDVASRTILLPIINLGLIYAYM